MIVDRVQVREVAEGRLERSARLRGGFGEFVLRLGAPEQAATAPADASPFLPVALMAAMFDHEDVEIDAPVSRRLLHGVEEVITAFASWDSRLHPSQVRASAELALPRRATGVGCFFSAGVDSLYAASRVRGFDPLTHLVYVHGLEPVYDEHVRAEEPLRVADAAALIGLPLMHLSSNARELLDSRYGYHMTVGAVMASVALSAAGALHRMVISSSASYVGYGPSGTDPVVDPLWSTEQMAVEHDSIAVLRFGKVTALARQRPDLLGHVKVCYRESRLDNCGRCGKCLHTMAALELVGVAPESLTFAVPLDYELLAASSVNYSIRAFEWSEMIRAAPAGHPLRAALEVGLRRYAMNPPTYGSGFSENYDLHIRALLAGGPHLQAASAAPPLVRATLRPRPAARPPRRLVVGAGRASAAAALAARWPQCRIHVLADDRSGLPAGVVALPATGEAALPRAQTRARARRALLAGGLRRGQSAVLARAVRHADAVVAAPGRLAELASTLELPLHTGGDEALARWAEQVELRHNHAP